MASQKQAGVKLFLYTISEIQMILWWCCFKWKSILGIQNCRKLTVVFDRDLKFAFSFFENFKKKFQKIHVFPTKFKNVTRDFLIPHHETNMEHNNFCGICPLETLPSKNRIFSSICRNNCGKSLLQNKNFNYLFVTSKFILSMKFTSEKFSNFF